MTSSVHEPELPSVSQSVAATSEASGVGKLPHLVQLDGWRGISIVCVLACHMLPLGPSRLQFNYMAGAAGMSLFFTLSGFLITSFLIRRPEIKAFLIRRLCRILPLAWGYLLIVLAVYHVSAEAWFANMFFVLNYQTQFIAHYNSHFWSLCLEMHFYLGVALLVGLFGARALYAIPAFCLGITLLRVTHGVELSIVSHFRMDEILAGAWLAMIYAKRIPRLIPMDRIPPWLFIIGLLAASNPWMGPLQYVRPYMGALLVGCTLYQPDHWLSRQMGRPTLKYLAVTSYALYVVHPITMSGWLGTGGRWERYLLKRPISFALTFLLAHISTFYWEKKWTQWGRSLTSKPASSRQPQQA